MVNLKRTTSHDKNFQNLIKELNNDLRARYDNLNYKYDANIQIDNLDTVVLGLINDDAVGCGCFKEVGFDIVEIKRMFVNPYFRGLGISSAILNGLTCWAKELNYSQVVLETGKQQQESINLYEKYGFSVIPNFGPYMGSTESVCMGKML
ncbi:MAG: GNAT family N-acetyltransferase, partial [Pyrinomonadaceae bacterium]|nr:GNAT family N-acetyltransferase [Sphingobacteriaceae bacterium]